MLDAFFPGWLYSQGFETLSPDDGNTFCPRTWMRVISLCIMYACVAHYHSHTFHFRPSTISQSFRGMVITPNSTPSIYDYVTPNAPRATHRTRVASNCNYDKGGKPKKAKLYSISVFHLKCASKNVKYSNSP